MSSQIRSELRLMWRCGVLPVLLVLTVLLAAGNVANASSEVSAKYGMLQHTRAQYAANKMDFERDLQRPADVRQQDGGETVGNLARYDYDAFSNSVVALSPSRSFDQALGYLGFIAFPALFFLLGLWMSTTQRRHRLEKVTLVRAGSLRMVAARQVALAAAAVVVLAAAVGVDALGRAIARPMVAASVPLDSFPPLAATPVPSPPLQIGLMLLVALFFGGAGILVGTLTGSFALPALVFVVWDYVIPILGPGDPRNWFTVLGHSTFSYRSGFELTPAIPMQVPMALAAAVAASLVFLAAAHFAARARNPRAT